MTGKNGLFAVSVVWWPKPGCEHDVECLLRAMRELTLQEAGCVAYWVHRVEDSSAFLLYEQYVDREAYESHHETSHYQTLVGEEAPALIIGRISTLSSQMFATQL